MIIVNKTNRGFMADLKELCYMIEAEQGIKNMDALYALITKEKDVIVDMIADYEFAPKIYFNEYEKGDIHKISIHIPREHVYEGNIHTIHFYQVDNRIAFGHSSTMSPTYHEMKII